MRRWSGLLYSTFEDALLGDSTPRLVIPAFKAPKMEIAVFKTDHHPDFKRDWKCSAWEIARSTAAAPTYYQGHEAGDAVFLDGGIWANNPIMVAVIDALSAYDVARDQIRVLSVGTGNPPFDLGSFASKGGLFHWLQIIKGAMYLTTDNAEAQANLLLGPQNIRRLSPAGKAGEIKLDDWTAARNMLPTLAINDFNVERASIAWFFRGRRRDRATDSIRTMLHLPWRKSLVDPFFNLLRFRSASIAGRSFYPVGSGAARRTAGYRSCRYWTRKICFIF